MDPFGNIPVFLPLLDKVPPGRRRLMGMVLVALTVQLFLDSVTQFLQ